MHTGISKILNCFSALLLVLIIGGTAGAQSEFVAPSGLNEAQLITAVDAFIQENEPDTAGAAISIFRNEQTIHQWYIGEADIENDVPVSDQTVFEWGSVTKTLVWVSALQLWEQGKLDLEADVRTYLPDGFFTKRKNDDPVTYLNLMHHNAGWEEMVKDLFLPQGSGFNGLEAELKSHEPLQIYETEQYTAYSNWGVALAGHIIERISGLTFADYVHRNIFEPLGMTQTALLPDLSDNAWVRARRPVTQGYTVINRLISPNWYQINLYPAGMATSTLRDFELFGKALAGDENGNTPLFAKAATLKKLLEPTLYYGDRAYPRNAHGFWAMGYSVPVYGHGGNTAAHSAILLLDPASHIGTVVLTNQSGEQVFNDGLGPILYGDFIPGESAADPEPIEEGVYQSSRTVQNGFAKIYSLMNRPSFRKTDAGYEGAALGQKIPLQYAAADLVNAKGMVGALGKDRNGNSTIQFYVMDLYKIPELQNILEWAVLVLWISAVLYSLVMLILGVINAIRVKNGKPPASYAADWKRTFTYLFSILSLVTVLLLAAGILTYQPSGSYPFGLYTSIQLALMVLMALLFVWQLFGLISSGATPRVRGIFACLVALVVTFTTYYWQFYRL